MSFWAGSPVAPRSDQVEISLFGPGYGECVVAHVGDGDWIIVDSCPRWSGDSRPVALAYLDALGVDVGRHVRVVVVSHWHDDHIRGMAEVVRNCPKATVVCSDALRSSEFHELVYAAGERSMMSSSGASEFRGILEELERRALTGVSPESFLRWASVDRLLWRRSGAVPVRLVALSPSDATKLAAFQDIARLAPEAGTPKRRLPIPRPNHVSVVLQLQVGGRCALLGSDLEQQGDTGGWNAIVGSAYGQGEAVGYYKVAHHGSHTGDDDQVWDTLVDDSAVATLSPFVRGGQRLPTDDDLRRIDSRGRDAYISSPPRGRKPLFKSRAAERAARDAVRKIEVVGGRPGHVRARTPAHPAPGEPWTVELGGEACSVSQLVAEAPASPTVTR